MCGRFCLTSPLESVVRAFGLESVQTNLPPRYNIAPTQAVVVLRLADEDSGTGVPAGTRQLVVMRWGLVPGWMKAMPQERPLINARVETVHEKPAFRGAYRHRRCLVPADGWYEWRESAGGGKRPFLIQPEAAEFRPFAFAAIWERWHGPGAENWLESVAILTRDADPAIAGIHARMPVVLAAEDHEPWLKGPRPVNGLALSGLRLADSQGWAIRPVSSRVNSPAYDDAELLAPLPESSQPCLF